MPGRHHSSHHDLANLVDGKVGYGILGASESVLEGFNQTHQTLRFDQGCACGVCVCTGIAE